MNDDRAAKLILGSFEAHRLTVIANSGRAWRWAEGVILFPEALCPMCNGVMTSTRIWEVNERAQKVVKAVSLVDGRLRKVTGAIHPHVDGSEGGPVCTGDARSTTEALFLGLGMGSPYWSADAKWYQDAFGHTCSSGSRRNSRNHLSESIKLGEAVKVAPVAVEPVVVATQPEPLGSSSTCNCPDCQRRRENVRRRQQRTTNAVQPERPLFDGTMAGNTESTGISAAEQPTGLHVDRL